MRLAALSVFGKSQTHCRGASRCPGGGHERMEGLGESKGECTRESKHRFLQREVSRAVSNKACLSVVVMVIIWV